jgi:hypothetical protein
MPDIYFILFELVIYIQLALCLHHAWRQGTTNLLSLFAGILFRVTLELATIRQLEAHEYDMAGICPLFYSLTALTGKGKSI